MILLPITTEATAPADFVHLANIRLLPPISQMFASTLAAE
jgi:hypothetical protein